MEKVIQGCFHMKNKKHAIIRCIPFCGLKWMNIGQKIKDVCVLKRSSAVILCKNPDALSIVSSAARMSTQSGTALEVYQKSGNHEKDLKLIMKVLSSGHKSVIEHQTLSVAFNDVSVLVEQFVIEFRLASYTVKSRRYVDFSSAGYVIPQKLTGKAHEMYCARMNELFGVYTQLLEMGVPKEDARFVLPYCLRSNFFMTLDARELIHMICTMLYGRGSAYEEIYSLGQQLKQQFGEIYPGVIDAEKHHYAEDRPMSVDCKFSDAVPASGSADLIDYPACAEKKLESAMAFSGRFEKVDGSCLTKENMSALLNDIRPRELEVLNYTFKVCDVSLACLTHFTRHRMQSLLIPKVICALEGGKYVLPESISINSEAAAIYSKAFSDQAVFARELAAENDSEDVLSYCAMSGHVLDFLMTVNARELLHFSKLRTCSRAQWEIREVARKMLISLNEVSPKIFGGYGPSCAVSHCCPEGKMSCGHPVYIEDGIWKTK